MQNQIKCSQENITKATVRKRLTHSSQQVENKGKHKSIERLIDLANNRLYVIGLGDTKPSLNENEIIP